LPVASLPPSPPARIEFDLGEDVLVALGVARASTPHEEKWTSMKVRGVHDLSRTDLALGEDAHGATCPRAAFLATSDV